PEALWVRGDDFGVVRDRLALGGHLLDLRTPLARHDEVFLPVHGAHQADNAAAAVAAVEAFFGRPLDDDVVAEAFAGLRLPGRFEVLHRAPLLVLDGAHNPAGAAAAAATLAGEFTIRGTRRWVLGLLRGRDVDEVLDAFGVRPGDQVIATTPPSPRGLPAAELAEAVAARGVDVVAEPEGADAVERAWTTTVDARHAAVAAGPPGRRAGRGGRGPGRRRRRRARGGRRGRAGVDDDGGRRRRRPRHGDGLALHGGGGPHRLPAPGPRARRRRRRLRPATARPSPPRAGAPARATRDFAGRGRRPYPRPLVKNRTFVMCKPDAVERGLIG